MYFFFRRYGIETYKQNKKATDHRPVPVPVPLCKKKGQEYQRPETRGKRETAGKKRRNWQRDPYPIVTTAFSLHRAFPIPFLMAPPFPSGEYQPAGPISGLERIYGKQLAQERTKTPSNAVYEETIKTQGWSKRKESKLRKRVRRASMSRLEGGLIIISIHTPAHSPARLRIRKFCFCIFSFIWPIVFSGMLCPGRPSFHEG